jgi:protocatechuate 3,4-dioxygenase beta subunit
MFSKLIIVILFFSNISYANVPADGIISKCSVTPSIKNLKNMPDIVGNTNNLRKITGSFKSAEGINIVIFGRLLDKNCIPISDAKIEIWQTNHFGHYQNYNKKSKKNYDPNFIGSGSMDTNNLGQFNFITIFPGKYKGHTSFINIAVTHDNMKDFHTKMYFPDDNGHKKDPDLNKMSQKNKLKLKAIKLDKSLNENLIQDEDLYNGNIVYLFDIVVPEVVLNKIY